ncbi:amidohydrolase family protein [bacterium]|nr:amidohydrolase family protein [bacterium]
MDLDLIITGGTVYDGSGSEGFRADVGVAGDRVKAVGDLSQAVAPRTLDATGLAVCPGFIDPHTHCHVDVDKDILHSDNLLRQGITTVIAGNCGGSGWPVGEHLAKVEREGFKSNYAMLVGHHTIRRVAMEGSESPWPTYEQTVAMQDMVRQGLEEGAIGITVGYAQRHETFEEIVDVTRPAADAGAIYASHIRSEGKGLLQAVAEAIEVAHQTGIAVQISHLKTDGPAFWDKLDLVLEMMEDAVARGLDVAADRYPYIGWHGGSTNIMNRWCYEEAQQRGGREHLKDPDVIEHFRQEIASLLAQYGGPDKLMFTSLKQPDPEVDGKTVADLMAQWGAEAIDVSLEIERRNAENAIGAVGFTMSEDNLKTILAHPLVMVGTDAHLEVFGRYATHPRNYGTYPRVLGKYVREERLMSLGEAVEKMTSKPARRYGLRDRGWLRPGYFADLVIFDPATVADNAAFTNAHQYPTGMPFVLVNGQVAVDNDVTAAGHFGRVLRRDG